MNLSALPSPFINTLMNNGFGAKARPSIRQPFAFLAGVLHWGATLVIESLLERPVLAGPSALPLGACGWERSACLWWKACLRLRGFPENLGGLFVGKVASRAPCLQTALRSVVCAVFLGGGLAPAQLVFVPPLDPGSTESWPYSSNGSINSSNPISGSVSTPDDTMSKAEAFLSLQGSTMGIVDVSKTTYLPDGSTVVEDSQASLHDSAATGAFEWKLLGGVSDIETQLATPGVDFSQDFYNPTLSGYIKIQRSAVGDSSLQDYGTQFLADMGYATSGYTGAQYSLFNSTGADPLVGAQGPDGKFSDMPKSGKDISNALNGIAGTVPAAINTAATTATLSPGATISFPGVNGLKNFGAVTWTVHMPNLGSYSSWLNSAWDGGWTLLAVGYLFRRVIDFVRSIG